MLRARLAVVRTVSGEEFEREVLGAAVPVVVDFWAPWCGPCKAVEPILVRLADQSGGRVDFVRLDVDADPVTASRYDVLTLPTAILFESGEPRAVVAGARKQRDYERAWAAWLQPDPVTGD
jgi:thioredoxin 1